MRKFKKDITTEAKEFNQLFKNKKAFANFDSSGNLIYLETDDQGVIIWAESKGLVEQ